MRSLIVVFSRVLTGPGREFHAVIIFESSFLTFYFVIVWCPIILCLGTPVRETISVPLDTKYGHRSQNRSKKWYFCVDFYYVATTVVSPDRP